MKKTNCNKSDKTIYVIGHIHPDTDSVCSSICYAHLLSKIYGGKIVPARAGELNPETKYVLKKWKTITPTKLTSLKNKNAILVDHNERSQAVKDIKKANIIEIVDNHPTKPKNAILNIPVESEPSGATASLIAAKYQWFNIKITKPVAGLLLSALLSDTLILKSPSTTKKDRILAKKLAKIAKVNVKKYGQEILISGSVDFSNTKTKSELKKIILSDFKEYKTETKQQKKKTSSYKIGIGQVLVSKFRPVLKQKDRILEEMKLLLPKQKLKQLFLMVTNLKNGKTHLFYVGNKKQVEKKFKTKSKFQLDEKSGIIYLPKICSRKDQVVSLVI